MLAYDLLYYSVDRTVGVCNLRVVSGIPLHAFGPTQEE